jgi:hypothetical protein
MKTSLKRLVFFLSKMDPNSIGEARRKSHIPLAPPLPSTATMAVESGARGPVPDCKDA